MNFSISMRRKPPNSPAKSCSLPKKQVENHWFLPWKVKNGALRRQPTNMRMLEVWHGTVWPTSCEPQFYIPASRPCTRDWKPLRRMKTSKSSNWMIAIRNSAIRKFTLKMDGWKMNFLLGWPKFRGYAGFRECTWPLDTFGILWSPFGILLPWDETELNAQNPQTHFSPPQVERRVVQWPMLISRSLFFFVAPDSSGNLWMVTGICNSPFA